MTGKEISSLYRSFNPRMSLYSPDGQGRDMYINYNNGGFWNKGSKYNRSSNDFNNHHIGPYHYKFIAKHVAPLKYISDGSGRDGYVIHESGGLKRDYKALNQYHLTQYSAKDFLRTPESCIFNFQHKKNNSGRSVDTVYISKQEHKLNKEKKNIERNLINRLYPNESIIEKKQDGNKLCQITNEIEKNTAIKNTSMAYYYNNSNKSPSANLFKEIKSYRIDTDTNLEERLPIIESVKNASFNYNSDFFTKNICKINNYENKKKENNNTYNNKMINNNIGIKENKKIKSS